MLLRRTPSIYFFFFFNDTATTEIYTLSLHDALPILRRGSAATRARIVVRPRPGTATRFAAYGRRNKSDGVDRKSTRLNSSHSQISYAVFCLKKKKTGCRQVYGGLTLRV